MPADYAQILRENLWKYGNEKHHLDYYGQLHPDRTHFLLELLQNAEDAGAQHVAFDLFPDRLEVRHDGRPFDERDVRGVCGVGETTKSDDLTKIGRFGIGFKSVYAYTSSPEIHSGEEHFRILGFVRPEATPPRQAPLHETLFVFPFDSDQVPGSRAFFEIAHALRNLDPRAILFLKSIREITWTSWADGPCKGRISRTTRADEDARRVTLLTDVEGAPSTEEWLVFDRQVQLPDGDMESNVEVAFSIERRDDGEHIKQADGTSLVVWFPTEKETKLGFLIQGPYRTTPARDNVPPDDDWNRYLVIETAALVGTVLPKLCARQLMSVELLRALPIVSDNFPETGMFRPIFNRVREALLADPLLPTTDGRHVRSESAKIARTADLRVLLDSANLTEVFPSANTEPLGWLPDELTQDRNRELLSYLRTELKIEEVTPDTLATRFNEKFIAAQDDDWVINFYQYLTTVRNLWQPSSSPRTRGPLLGKPIIRLDSGKHVAPNALDGTPLAYLPPPHPTSFPIVSRAICVSEKAVAFLKSLELNEPDVVAEVLQDILPGYNGGNSCSVDLEEHRQDLRKIRRAMAATETSAASRAVLIARLKETPFVRAKNAASGAFAYCLPSNVYVSTPELERYFGPNPTVWILQDSDKAELEDVPNLAWKVLGLSALPRRVRVANPSLSPEEKTQIRQGGSCTEEREITDYELDGLEAFLDQLGTEVGWGQGDSQTASGPLLLWDILRKLLDADRRAFDGKYTWFYYSECVRSFPARFLKRLRAAEWLPGRDGQLLRPADLSLLELPSSFERDEILAHELNMRAAALDLLAEQHGVSPKMLQFALEHPGEVEDLRRKTEADDRSRMSPARTAPAQEINFRVQFEANFTKPQIRPGDDYWLPPGPMPNPKVRRERIEREIHDGQMVEPERRERFEQVPSVRWEPKEGRVRAFLLSQYDGRCQICDGAFMKRDGTPYFEGVYLVSHTTARWIDRPGNVLCLCANCSAKFQHGPVDGADVLPQVLSYDLVTSDPDAPAIIRLRLCHEEKVLRFTHRHLLDLQALLRADSTPLDVPTT